MADYAHMQAFGTSHENYGLLFKTVLYVLLAVTLVAATLSILQISPRNYLIFEGIAALMAVVALLIAIRGKYRIAALTYCLLSWLLLTTVCIFYGGVNSAAFYGYIFVVVFAGLFLGSASAIVFEIASLTSGILLVIAARSGLLPAQYVGDNHIGHLAGFFVYSVMCLSVIHITTANMNRALKERQNADEALSDRAERLAVVNRVAKAAGSTLDLDDLLFIAYREISSIFVTEAFYIALYDQETEELEFRIRYDRGEREEPYSRPVGIGLSARVVQNRTALLIKDFASERDRLPTPGIWGTHAEASSWLGVPMMIGAEVIGIVSVQSYQPNAYTEDDAILLGTIADQLAVAVENARLYEALRNELSERKLLEERLVQGQKMEAVGRLAGGVAHDFNNLLTGIIGYTELAIGQSGDNEELKKDLVEIKDGVMQAASLTGQLLTFSRKQILKPELLDLNTVIESIGNMLGRIIGEDVELETSLQPSLPHIKADPSQIQQVVMNLAVNARDAMPRGGRLTIATALLTIDDEGAKDAPVSAGRYVILSVSDTGIGIPEEILDHLFEPFYTTKSKGKGTGLGLATVHGIVTQSGGEIAVESTEGRGTTFTVYIPAAGEDVTANSSESEYRTALEGTETVLLVEDEDVIREFAAKVLVSFGYTVIAESDAEDAIRSYDENRGSIDLVVTDVVLPEGMSGPELAKIITTKDRKMGVLYISGHAESEISKHGAIEDSISFLKKPFTTDALVRKVREILDGK